MVPAKVRQTILNSFIESRERYESLTSYVASIVETIVQTSDMRRRTSAISARTKEVDSLRKKLEQPDKQYASIADITDLSGVRVVTVFADDVDRIASLLDEEFEKDEGHSVDKRKAVDERTFGYASLHRVYSVRRTGTKVSTELGGTLFEVQIRSSLQHSWAEVEHDLGYKGVNIATFERRRFSALAAVFELADRELIGIRDAIGLYKESVAAKIDEPMSLPLDAITVEELFASDAEIRTFEKKLAAETRLELTNETGFGTPASRLLDALNLPNLAEFKERVLKSENRFRQLIEAVTTGGHSGAEYAHGWSTIWLLTLLELGQRYAGADLARELEEVGLRTAGMTPSELAGVVSEILENT